MPTTSIDTPIETEQPVIEPEAVTGAATSRLIALDFLRGLAILLVLGHHPICPPRDTGIFKVFATAWARIGWTGVDLFFVLSGFLIGGLLFKEIKATGNLDAKRFIIRRGFKIWPSYYLFLVAQFLFIHFFMHWSIPDTMRVAIAGALHYQNYTLLTWHTWTLAVEEHFYLLLPLTLVLLNRKGKSGVTRGFPYVAALVAISCLTYRCAVAIMHDYETSLVYFPTHARIDSLCFGTVLALLYHFHRSTFDRIGAQRGKLTVLAILCASTFIPFPASEYKYVWTVGYTLLYLGYGGLLTGLVTAQQTASRWRTFLDGKVVALFARVGRYSYQIYLWHRFLGDWMSHWWPRSPLQHWDPGFRWALLTTVYVSLSIVIGAVMAKVIELPFLAIRDRFYVARSNAI